MAATNKLLGKRVDVLTDALVEARDDMREAIDSGSVEALHETCGNIDDLIGPEDADEGSVDEESQQESDEEEEESEEE